MNARKYKYWKKTWPYVAAVATLLAVWQIATLMIPGYVLPGVPEGLGQAVRNLADPEYLNDLKTSLLRLMLGYPVACFIGALLGLVAGLSRKFAVYLRSLIAILQSIPPITWIPFLIILLGFGNGPIIIVITIASFFPMALSVMNAAEGVSRTHLEVGRVFGATRRQLLRKVYLPETVPAVVTGAQVSFGNAWRSLIASEMVGGASSGLGFTISYAGEVANMPQVLASIVTIGALAMLLDHVLLEQIKRKVLHWRYINGEE